VVAVVAELVVHLVVGGEHAQQPLQPVARLVEHVGRAVRAGQPARVERVGEGARMVAVGHHHHVRRVGRRGHVLQVVRRVRPPAAHHAELPRARAVVHDQAVELVDRVAEERVVARALLAHVVEQRVGRAVVGVRAHAHGRRLHGARRDAIGARPPQRAEVQPVRGCARAERPARARRERTEHDAARGIAHRERAERLGHQRADHRHLGRVGT
jgi:hypothetical protein